MDKLNNGVSARNQYFQERNGTTIFYIFVGIIVLAFWPILLKILGCIVLTIIVFNVMLDLYRNI